MPTLKIPDGEIDYQVHQSSHPGGLQPSVGRLSRFRDRYAPL